MSEDKKTDIQHEDIDDNQDVSDIDVSILCPDADAPAEPYHAIMFIDQDGVNNGDLWGQGSKLMLFESLHAAEKIVEALANPSYQLRGVTSQHLEALQNLTQDGRAELFVIVGFTPRGNVEAMPLTEHLARKSKAGNPPPLPKK